jgi:hypothetical protein
MAGELTEGLDYLFSWLRVHRTRSVVRAIREDIVRGLGANDRRRR